MRFVTGHSKLGGLPEDLDWHAVADPSATTVFYMGAKFAGEIAACLIAHGLAPDTPVALGEALGRPAERVLVITLASLGEAAAQRDPSQPVVIAVGRVFGEATAHTTSGRAAIING